MTAPDFDQWLKLLGLVGGLGSFIWGIYQWRAKSELKLAQDKAESDRIATTRKLEATRPFLERQLKLYPEALQVAAVLATSTDATERSIAVALLAAYWGELALVENQEVEAAMVAFGVALKEQASLQELESLCLQLARACRLSLDRSWGIDAWTSPDKAAL
jgi:hypothetical protein